MKSVSRTKLPYFEEILNTRTARTALSLNVHQFCKPKPSCFMREMVVKRNPFFLEFLMFYEVYYWLHKGYPGVVTSGNAVEGQIHKVLHETVNCASCVCVGHCCQQLSTRLKKQCTVFDARQHYQMKQRVIAIFKDNRSISISTRLVKSLMWFEQIYADF